MLAANVARIAELVGLTAVESRLFEFAVLMHAWPALREVCDKPENLRLRQISDRLAVLLDLPRHEVYQALRPGATLARSGLLSLTRNSLHGGMDHRLELLSESLPERLTESVVEPTDWLRDMVRPGQPGHLQWTDYAHLHKPLAVLRPYLRQALQEGMAGVNIFLYGPPGTGKTQLARLLAQDMACELFEVTTEDEDNDPIGGRKRVKAHCAAFDLGIYERYRDLHARARSERSAWLKAQGISHKVAAQAVLTDYNPYAQAARIGRVAPPMPDGYAEALAAWQKPPQKPAPKPQANGPTLPGGLQGFSF